MKRSLIIALAVLAVALTLVSCKKTKQSLGFCKVEAEKDELCCDFNITHAWYFFDDKHGGFYDIVFSDEDDLNKAYHGHWAWIDLPKIHSGATHDLSEELSTDNWVFDVGTYSLAFANKLTGSICLKVDEANNHIVFDIDGTDIDGDKIRIKFSGKATRVEKYIGGND